MRPLFAVVLLSLCSLPASGQTLWSRPYQPNQITVEALVPDTDDASFPSGAAFITGTASLNENVEFLIELPFATYQPSGVGPSARALGNPYVGVGLSSTQLPILVQLGGRIPAAPANRASGIGSAADVGRTRAFRPDEFSLSGFFNGRYTLSQSSTLRLRTGLAYASRPSPPETISSRIRDWHLHYDAQLWREGKRLLTGFTLTGRALLNSPGTTAHHASLSLMANWDRAQPGLLVGTSLNDLFRNGSFTPFAGLTLSFSYR